MNRYIATSQLHITFVVKLLISGEQSEFLDKILPLILYACNMLFYIDLN